MKKLLNIQAELKAPKGQYNSFGKYKYRSAEDILESVKPLCIKHNAVLTLSDEMVLVGDRYYIKATATIIDLDDNNQISNTAYARESEDKKGMDSSQITGTASSYARKYALNGLFLIDDTKDADTDEYHHNTHREPTKYDKSPQPTSHAKITLVQKDKIVKGVADGKLKLDGLLQYYKVNSVDELNYDQANEIIKKKLGGTNE